MKLVFAYLLALALAITVTEGIVCPRDYCATANCTNVTEEECEAQNKSYDPSGSFCGCCSTCLTILHEGESCTITRLRGEPPTATCEDGTTCQQVGNSSTYECQSTS
ncbi:uncharacterized protein LOC107225411 [Neodiprion lecontei]|uniref:Uncharacterized protein LOC107225411 n=1 Tax=Neodiprion lecontei TaxID=441921 RepID=A0ABM3FTR3_NEOLC|nr:uncharacterized protein LOC107225411 [Neodiprion lecontei]